MNRPLVLVAAGLDPTGSAGLLADLRALARHGVAACALVTGSTAQSESGVTRVVATDAALLDEQLRILLAAGAPRPQAIKIGMVATPAIALRLARALDHLPAVPVVIDPVLEASRGGRLYDGEAASLLPLLRSATVATPNLPEAMRLTGRTIEDEPSLLAAAEALRGEGVRAVLVKGGHLDGPTAVDLLLDESGPLWLRAERSPGPSVRGTGCALASTIAALLARGNDLRSSVRAAKEDVTRRIAAAHASGEHTLG